MTREERQKRQRSFDRKRRERRNAPPGGPTEEDLPELREARRLWQHFHFDQALALFKRAVELHPNNITALLDVARAFGARHEITQAQEWLERVLALVPDDPLTLHLVAQSYRMIFRPEKAEPLWRRVLEMTDEIPDAYLELALIEDRRHRIGEAVSLIDQCVNKFPDYLEPRIVQARLLRRSGRPAEAETVLKDLGAHRAAAPALKAQALIDLGELYDQQGQFDLAFDTAHRGKAIQLQQDSLVKRLSDHLMSHFTTLCAQAQRPDFERWSSELSAAGQSSARVALLTGFPRSGTTLLEQVLDAHDQVISSEELEVFSRDIFPQTWRDQGSSTPTVEALSRVPPEPLIRLRQQYLHTMEEVRGQPIAGRWHIDKNPTLTLLIPAFRRLFPEAAILLALRDPRDVVLSCYLRYLPLNTNSVWYLTLQRTAERYATDMRAWLALREKLPQPWLQVRYEDFINDFEPQARRCLDLLNLPWNPDVLNYREKLKHKVVHSPTYEAVARPIYKSAIGRWRNYERHLAPVMPILEPFVSEFGYK